MGITGAVQRSFVLFLTITLTFAVVPPFIYNNVDQCGENEYYNFANLVCTQCGINQVGSSDGLSCQCQSFYKMTSNNGGPDISCELCGNGQKATMDGWNCIGCSINAQGDCEACPLPGQIAVEYTPTGVLLTNRTCETCDITTTQPDQEGLECERCAESNIEYGASCDATACPIPTNENLQVCFPAGTDVRDPPAGTYTVPYPVLENEQVTSWFLSSNYKDAKITCTEYQNLTGCQTWGNMCTMVLSRDAGLEAEPACSEYVTLIGQDEWPEYMPFLFYQDTNDALTDDSIDAEYTFNTSSPTSQLQIVAAQYTPNGSFIGLDSVLGGKLQLCKDTVERMDAAYSFATTYKSSCSISAVDLWDKYTTEFYDLYLQYDNVNEVTVLYPIPQLLYNYGSDNQGSNQDNWKLTRRFFLVDNLSGKESEAAAPTAIRYASSIKIEVSLQPDVAGKILPPLLKLTYTDLSYADDYTTARSVPVSFEVTYYENQSSAFQSMSIAVGVFCAAFLLYAMAKTNAWRRRSGLIVIDISSMIKFIIFACGLIADAFLIVTVGISLYWTLFFKRQDKVYLLLPTAAQAEPFNTYVIIAFVMKFIDVLHMLIIQCRSEIFLIDWERSRGRIVQASAAPSTKASVAPISAWRSFFVANEWNELQEIRRSNPIFQVMAVLFFLEVVGLENLTTTDPRSTINPSSDEYIGAYSYVLRFGTAAGIYLLVGVAQWLFFTLIYERFVEDALRNFVDLCSMANISVFVLTQNNYGYYIHGRSVHGFADTNMREIKVQLKREEENLVGQRGLEPNTDQQTFEMLLSANFRERYDSIVLPLRAPGAARGAGAGNNEEKISEAYVSLNKFLSTFVDHGMADIDYIVKDKLLLEKILDMEFYDPTDKGFFFNDDGHAFQNSIFYGNESTLLVFELLLFCIVDMIFTDYVLAGVITCLVSLLLIKIRDSFGRSNVARKTLVDERFLI